MLSEALTRVMFTGIMLTAIIFTQMLRLQELQLGNFITSSKVAGRGNLSADINWTGIFLSPTHWVGDIFKIPV